MKRELESVSNRKVSSAKGSQSGKSFLPTIMTRLSPFFPQSNNQSGAETITEPIVVKNQWGKVTITGSPLSICDETVLLSLLMLLKKYDSNSFETTPDEICEFIGVNPRKGTSDAIMDSIQHMSQTHISIEKRVYGCRGTKTEMEGNIIIGITENDLSKKIALELHPYFLSSFRDGLITRIDIRMRSDLRGDISKALYRFYEGQRGGTHAINILRLSKGINVSCNGDRSRLKMKIKKALRELQEEGYLRIFIMPYEDVAVFKSRYRAIKHYRWCLKDDKIVDTREEEI